MIHLWDLPLGVIDTQDSTMGPKPMSFNPIWSLEVNSLNYCGLSWESIRQLIAFPSLTDSNLVRLPVPCFVYVITLVSLLSID